ncbi:potassium-transporting ATPase subunit KdpA [Hydrotalea sp.]|uniref:potassium-transporting ATPase subunit KdpA n=1 Tax=Hydrotalea sp. TaxID=2881279 RepID=UPI003D098294
MQSYSELYGVIAMFIIAVLIAIPLGRYMGKVFLGEDTWLDVVLNPVDRFIYSLMGIDENVEMNWKQHIKVLLMINFIWFVLAMLVLTNMSHLPFNPDHNPSMPLDLAFNTAISFITNTNIQHYAGETAMSYLGQLVLMLFQFISAASGIAISIVVIKAMKEGINLPLGNFYFYFVRTCTRVLLPICIVLSIIFLYNGVPMTFQGKDTITTLQGDTVQVSKGPVAAFVAIKQLGTNGGGFFGPNSAHPLENPNYFTNMVETIAIYLLPIALIFTMGYMLNRKKLAWIIFGIMTLGFILLVVPTISMEIKGNTAIAKMGINNTSGNMEGKEVRFGSMASAYWAIATTVTSNGSVNAMHDSFMPLSGMCAMLGMMINAFYGGVGVGFLNFYIFMILAVFISGLMVGRTPELLGKKIEAREMQIAMIVALLHPFLILTGTAIASYLYAHHPEQYAAWLSNPGYHGFSEMLYEFTSASANNGSEFAGLNANTAWWNIADGIVMLLARFIPIIGPVAIAASLSQKKYIPAGAGTLQIDTPTFGIMIIAVIIIIAALSFFPALTLGPVAEYFSF